MTIARKRIPKRDGSGKGKRANKGRGGCKTTRKKGRGYYDGKNKN